jgi:predicted flap endonuclease-1-like 5' DNA nuclease
MFKRMRRFMFALSGSAAAILVMYLLRKRSPKKFHPSGMETLINVDEVPPESLVQIDVTPVEEIANEPISEPEPEPVPDVIAPASTPNDLKRIEGIGPKTASILSHAGIISFQALSDLTPAEIKDILRAAKSRGVPTSWPAQAKLAAAEDWDGLTKLQAKLKGGL